MVGEFGCMLFVKLNRSGGTGGDGLVVVCLVKTEKLPSMITLQHNSECGVHIFLAGGGGVVCGEDVVDSVLHSRPAGSQCFLAHSVWLWHAYVLAMHFFWLVVFGKDEKIP